MLNISGSIESTQNADHIFKMQELGEFVCYYFKKHTF